jgi:hypothetical protein
MENQGQEKKYVRTVIIKKVFSNGSFVLNANFKTKTMLNHTNDDGWCNLTIGERKSPSPETGATHYAYVNEWKPEKKDEDLPF